MIHPTAEVARGAEIAADVDIGPFCVVGAHVKIAPGTKLLSHVVIDGHTSVGENNLIYPFAAIGTPPQDLKFKGEPSCLILGNHNVIREGVSMNVGTEAGTMETVVGDHCLFMAHAHVAHDCVVGDYVVMANSVPLAGHVQVQSYAILGGLAGVHQFCRIGHHAFIAGGGKVAQDVPPFCVAQGDRAQLVGINVVGLRRAGWDRGRIAAVRTAFKKLFQAGSTRLLSLERTEGELSQDNADVREMTDFIRSAKRGVCPPRQLPPSDVDEEG